MTDKETGRRETIRQIENARGVMPLAKFLRSVQNKSNLSRRERLRIVEQSILLLEMNYVHLPLKRAMHAIDPIQRLKLLKFRIETGGRELYSGMQFHQRMLEIFASLRDLHTLYLLPLPYKSHTAFLPFLIEQYFEPQGKRLLDRFLITRVVTEFMPARGGAEWAEFKPGVEVLYWNGIPIRRAIEINGESQAGSNPEARFARGLDNLTIRPLEISLPPDEKWVEITYRSAKGKPLTIKMEWLVYNSDEQPLSIQATKKRHAAIDIKKTKINQLKKKFFSTPDIRVRRRFADNFYVETRQLAGREIGYLRLFSFDVTESDDLVNEIKRVITDETFPRAGLIIDVRGNGGGKIRAGERILQFFTPRRIKPELFEFINSAINLEICQRDPRYHPWAASIAEAVVTGATYSLGFPVSSEADCNDIGQLYHGPVILITDALSYSTTDMFAAGFQDNEVGEVLGTSDNTGAGGANVWSYDDLAKAVGKASKLLFKPLPRKADLAIAMRRSIRVGQREGRPLEELGIAPDYRHYMTRRDLMNSNIDLLTRAAQLLARRPIYSLSVKPIGKSRGLLISAASKVHARDRKRQISHVDVFVNGRPHSTLTARSGALRGATVLLPKSTAKVDWMVQAFDHDNRLVAASRRRALNAFATKRT